MSAVSDAGLAISMGHVNLHYRRDEDGPLAARLLELLGLVKTDEMTLPNGSLFYRFTTNRANLDGGDGIIYLVRLPDALGAAYAAINDALKVGQPDEHPSVAGLRAAAAQDPEHNFHVGFLLNDLAQIEERWGALKELEKTDPAFTGRLKFLANRSLPGNAEFDARLDASPIYKDVTRYAYGNNGVQAFVETDIFVSGPLGEGLVFELDYILPDAKSHILSRVTLTEQVLESH